MNALIPLFPEGVWVFWVCSVTLKPVIMMRRNISKMTDSNESLCNFDARCCNFMNISVVMGLRCRAMSSLRSRAITIFVHMLLLSDKLARIWRGESELSCAYNEIKHRYCHCIAVQCGGWATSIQGIEGGSLLLLFMLAVKRGRCWVFPSWEGLGKRIEGMVPRNDGIHRD